MGQVICITHKSPHNEEIGCEDCMMEAAQANLDNFGSYNPEINELQQKLERLKTLLKQFE